HHMIDRSSKLNSGLSGHRCSLPNLTAFLPHKRNFHVTLPPRRTLVTQTLIHSSGGLSGVSIQNRPANQEANSRPIPNNGGQTEPKSGRAPPFLFAARTWMAQ